MGRSLTSTYREASTREGGVNDHGSEMVVRKAYIDHQKVGARVATYEQPMFAVVA